MSLPNNIYFQSSGFNIRFMDVRPKSENIQVNIFNPSNAEHSVVFMIPTRPTTPTDLEQVRVDMAANVLAELISKAEAHFTGLSQVVEG